MAIPSLAMIPSGYKDGKVYSVLPTNGDGDFDFSRGSNATRVNKDGLIETVTGDTPRLDYSDSSCPSLLLEPQRTNLITYSEDFSNSAYSKTMCTVTANQAISPDGTQNADLMTATDDDARLEDQVGSSGAEYNQSIYVKSAQISNVDCQLDFSGHSWTLQLTMCPLRNCSLLQSSLRSQHSDSASSPSCLPSSRHLLGRIPCFS